MWICRAGKDACYLSKVLKENRIFLFWDGFQGDYSSLKELREFRDIVQGERAESSKTSISNWAAQLHAFCIGMQCEDYIMIPHYKARYYTLARIIGVYEYNEAEKFRHSRNIEIVKTDIPKNIFDQSQRFSLNAFRTVYKVREEEELLKTIYENGEEGING